MGYNCLCVTRFSVVHVRGAEQGANAPPSSRNWANCAVAFTAGSLVVQRPLKAVHVLLRRNVDDGRFTGKSDLKEGSKGKSRSEITDLIAEDRSGIKIKPYIELGGGGGLSLDGTPGYPPRGSIKLFWNFVAKFSRRTA